MLFRNHIPACCAYCANGAKIDDDTVLCRYRSAVPIEGACRRFCYDPLKRIPEPIPEPTLSQPDDGDYSL